MSQKQEQSKLENPYDLEGGLVLLSSLSLVQILHVLQITHGCLGVAKEGEAAKASDGGGKNLFSCMSSRFNCSRLF